MRRTLSKSHHRGCHIQSEVTTKGTDRDTEFSITWLIVALAFSRVSRVHVNQIQSSKSRKILNVKSKTRGIQANSIRSIFRAQSSKSINRGTDKRVAVVMTSSMMSRTSASLSTGASAHIAS